MQLGYKNNVIAHLGEVIEDILSNQSNLRKSFRNFFIETMILYIAYEEYGNVVYVLSMSMAYSAVMTLTCLLFISI